MLLSAITTLAGYLLACSSAGFFVSASPVDPALCPSGFKYFRVKSPDGVSYGTCCGANLSGAVWEDHRPACSISPSLTTPAVSIITCPQETAPVKKGDLKVCVHLPPKTKRDTRCPNGDNYHVLQAFELSIGTCCAPNLAGAVWKDNKPACSLGIQFTTPAESVVSCNPGEHIARSGGLDVCITHAKMKRDELYCPRADKWLELRRDGKTYATCCGPNYVGVKWDAKPWPQCCDGKECEGRASSVEGCPSGWDIQSLNGWVAVCKKV